LDTTGNLWRIWVATCESRVSGPETRKIGEGGIRTRAAGMTPQNGLANRSTADGLACDDKDLRKEAGECCTSVCTFDPDFAYLAGVWERLPWVVQHPFDSAPRGWAKTLRDPGGSRSVLTASADIGRLKSDSPEAGLVGDEIVTHVVDGN